MTTANAAGARPRLPLNRPCADTLRALAEASVRQPAGPGLVARLNPDHPRAVTLRTLEQLHEAGLVTEGPHPLTPLLRAYTLSPAGRAWVHHHG
jgi:hypothetical protein